MRPPLASSHRDCTPLSPFSFSARFRQNKQTKSRYSGHILLKCALFRRAILLYNKRGQKAEKLPTAIYNTHLPGEGATNKYGLTSQISPRDHQAASFVLTSKSIIASAHSDKRA